ncbi:MAG: glutamate-5-semialdehyde dehydrogenase [Hyphomicrobiaceae bacterium]
MTAVAPNLRDTSDLESTMLALGKAASSAATQLATAPRDAKDLALKMAAMTLRAESDTIIAANARDIEAANAADRPKSFIDRLMLDAGRIESIAKGLETIAELEDPVGETIAEWRRPNGLLISRVRVPIGVIGIIYESRPNVTADAGALCLKSGNASILRGGSDSIHSSRAILACLEKGLEHAQLPTTAIQLVPSVSRDAVGMMLKGLNETIDVIVPRGGKSLVSRVQSEARVPVFAHLEGICHTYVDRGADLQDAIPIVVNAKMRRTGICGATETVLVDIGGDTDLLTPVVKALLEAGCEVRGDTVTQKVAADVKAASEQDWATEYLDAIVSVKTVDGVDEAIDHIAHYSSHHTDAILTECYGTAEQFLNRVDSAIVLHNASTQFADGGEFGMGAEIGIATGKMHARGPVGVEQLTTFKYIVRGSGQVRPL